MKKTMLLVLPLLFIYALSFADGPPIHDNQITVEHATIKLTEEQVKQANIYQIIVLTDAQIRKIKKNKTGTFPKMLTLLTDPYNSCSCGLTFYGLWSKRNEVQIPDYNLDYTVENLTAGEGNGEASEDEDWGMPYYRNFEQVKKDMRPDRLNIDYNGNLYQNGRKVNNLKIALKALEGMKRKKDDSKWVWVSTPPLKNIKTITRTYLNAKKFFESHGYEVGAYFENEYIDNLNGFYGRLLEFNSEKLPAKSSVPARGCSIKCGAKWSVKASSEGRWKKTVYSASNLNDGSLKTAWVEGVPGQGLDEDIIFSDFKGAGKGGFTVNNFFVYNGFVKNKKTFEENARVKDFVLYKNKTPLYILRLLDTSAPQKVFFPDVTMSAGDELALKIIDVFGGIKYQDTAVSILVPGYEKRAASDGNNPTPSKNKPHNKSSYEKTGEKIRI